MLESTRLKTFLEKAADYFSSRPTDGEDRAYWANVFNAENCIKASRAVVEYGTDEELARVIDPGAWGSYDSYKKRRDASVNTMSKHFWQNNMSNAIEHSLSIARRLREAGYVRSE